MNNEELQAKVLGWADTKGITNPEKALTQFAKLIEEIGELSAAINRKDIKQIIDSVGDIQVVLIILSDQLNIGYSEALNTAWHTIEHRTGKTTEDGVFIKDGENLRKE